MTDLPASGYWENAARTQAEAKQWGEDIRDFIAQMVGGGATSELTMSVGGTVTPTAGFHTIDTYGDAASDDLLNIVVTNLPAGSLLLIKAEDASKTVVVNNGAGGSGQILTLDGASVTLDETNIFLLLVRVGTDWLEVFRGYMAASATRAGWVALATSAQTIAMTDTATAVTPDDVGELLQYGWQYVPASAFTPYTTNGPEAGTIEFGTSGLNMDYLAFDGAANEKAGVWLPFDPTWDRSTIKYKAVWSPGDSACTAGDKVQWELGGGSFSDGDALNGASPVGTKQTCVDTVLDGKDEDLHVGPASSAITVAGTPALSDMIYLEIEREVEASASEDDMTEDAFLFGVLVQFKRTNAIAAW